MYHQIRTSPDGGSHTGHAAGPPVRLGDGSQQLLPQEGAADARLPGVPQPNPARRPPSNRVVARRPEFKASTALGRRNMRRRGLGLGLFGHLSTLNNGGCVRLFGFICTYE